MSININDITIGQARQLIALLHGNNAMPAATLHEEKENEGLCICVLDKGFVYVGELIIDANGKFFTIRNARNVRRWGTSEGLGQLAMLGKQENTVLDNAGTVRAMTSELKHWIQCRGEAWK